MAHYMHLGPKALALQSKGWLKVSELHLVRERPCQGLPALEVRVGRQSQQVKGQEEAGFRSVDPENCPVLSQPMD